MNKIINNTAELVNMLNVDMKMSVEEIADYVGVNRYVVSNWKNGKFCAKEKNYDALYDMVAKLSGKNVKYRGQAIDILKGGI